MAKIKIGSCVPVTKILELRQGIQSVRTWSTIQKPTEGSCLKDSDTTSGYPKPHLHVIGQKRTEAHERVGKV